MHSACILKLLCGGWLAAVATMPERDGVVLCISSVMLRLRVEIGIACNALLLTDWGSLRSDGLFCVDREEVVGLKSSNRR